MIATVGGCKVFEAIANGNACMHSLNTNGLKHFLINITNISCSRINLLTLCMAERVQFKGGYTSLKIKVYF